VSDDQTQSPSTPDALIPPQAPAEDSRPKPSRPTTRAGRKAAAEAAKAKKSPESKPKTSGGKATPRRAPLETRLTDSLIALGAAIAAAGGVGAGQAVQADGVLVIQHAPDVAKALSDVAKDDPRIAAALERMLTVSVWGGLFAALLPLGIGIAANHGAVPPHIAAMLTGGQVPDFPPDDLRP
jgi:hypothetical protein